MTSKTHTLPQGTMAAAFVDAKLNYGRALSGENIGKGNVPSPDKTPVHVGVSNFMFYDLLEHVDSLLMSGELKARTFGSLAWKLDTMIVNTARAVFKAMRTEALATGSLDAYAEFVNRIKEMTTSADHTVEVGFEDTGLFNQLTAMLNQRKFWHDAAQKHSTRTNYQPKTLVELIVSEEVQKVDGQTREKLAIEAEFMAPGDAARQAIELDGLVSLQASQFQTWFESKQKTTPAILRIIEIATQKAVFVYDDECPPFHELPIQLQRQLIESTMNSVERTCSNLCSDKRVTTNDYRMFKRDAIACTKALAEVLKAPKFQEV
jgi:hypothetical protein